MEEEREPDVARRVEREPERIGDRRIGRGFGRGEDELPVLETNSPEDDAETDQELGQALARSASRPRHRNEPRRDDDSAEEPLEDESLESDPADPEHQRAGNEAEERRQREKHDRRSAVCRKSSHAVSIGTIPHV